MDPEVKKAWLEKLGKERDELAKECDNIKSVGFYLQEHIEVLKKVAEHHEKQAAVQHYQGDHVTFKREAEKELKELEGLLSGEKRDIETKGNRLAFVKNLLWYINEKE